MIDLLRKLPAFCMRRAKEIYVVLSDDCEIVVTEACAGPPDAKTRFHLAKESHIGNSEQCTVLRRTVRHLSCSSELACESTPQ